MARHTHRESHDTAPRAGGRLVASDAAVPGGVRRAGLRGHDDFLEQGASSIAKAASDGMSKVSSMRVIGSQEDKELGFTRIDLRLDDTSCTGSPGQCGGTIRVLKNAEEPGSPRDEKFWRTQVGSATRARQAGDPGTTPARWSAIG